MKRMKLTTAGRVVIFVIVLALLAGIGGFGYNYYKNNIADDKPISSGTQSGSTSQKPTTKPSAGKTDTSDPVINLSLDEWVGWKPIIDANQGLTTQPGSIFDQLGIKVNINIINDATASSNALITGELNAAGYTTNRTAFLSGKFQEAGLDVVMPVFTNYSAGGDGIIAKSGINTVNDLLGKKIGVPRFSEAQTLVAWFVNKSDLSDADKQSIIDNMILFDDASETGEAFFAGQLDVAATWQPYLSYATENGLVSNLIILSHILNASSWLCVTIMIVLPVSAWTSKIKRCILLRVLSSKADNGSSISRYFGLTYSVLANARRCCIPPDS